LREGDEMAGVPLHEIEVEGAVGRGVERQPGAAGNRVLSRLPHAWRVPCGGQRSDEGSRHQRTTDDPTTEDVVDLPYRQVEAEHGRSEEHTSELQSPYELVCRLLLDK